MTENPFDPNHTQMVESAEAIENTQDRLAGVHEKLTGTTKVDPELQPDSQKEVKQPEKSMFTEEEIKQIEDDYKPAGHWDR